MKLSASRTLAAALLSTAMFTGMFPASIHGEEPKTESPRVSVTNYQLDAPEGDPDQRIHIQQITLFDQMGNPVVIGSDIKDDGDQLAALCAPGEAAASKRAVFSNDEDAKQGIAKIEFQMMGKDNPNAAPIDVMFIVDQSSSMNMYTEGGILRYNMPCLTRDHYYLVQAGTLGAETNCLINISDFNDSGPDWSQWSFVEKSSNKTYAYQWSADLADCIKEQTTAFANYRALASNEEEVSEESETTEESELSPQSEGNTEAEPDEELLGEESDPEVSEGSEEEQEASEPESGTNGLRQETWDGQPLLIGQFDEAYNLDDSDVVIIQNTKRRPRSEWYNPVFDDYGMDYVFLDHVQDYHVHFVDGVAQLISMPNPEDVGVPSLTPVDNGGHALEDRGFSPDPDASGCTDRMLLTKQAVSQMAEQILGENEDNRVGVVLFNGSQSDAYCQPLTTDFNDLKPLLDYTRGGESTNYELAFAEAERILDQHDTDTPLYTVFVTDGLPNDALTSQHFSTVPGNFTDNAQYQGYEKANEYKEAYGELYVMGLSMDVNEYMTSLASEPRKAMECPTPQSFVDSLREIYAETMQGFPTSVELSDVLGTGFELLIDQEHPFILNDDAYTHETQLPEDLSISNGTSVSWKLRQLTDTKQSMSYFIQPADPSTTETGRNYYPLRISALTEYFATNRSARLRYVSGNENPGETPKTDPYYRGDGIDVIEEPTDGEEDEETPGEAEGEDPTGESGDDTEGEDTSGESGDETNDSAGTDDAENSESDEPTANGSNGLSTSEPKTCFSYLINNGGDGRIVVRGLSSPQMQVKNALLSARKSMNIQEGTVYPGDEVQYTITVKKQGDVDLDNVFICDGLDKHLEYLNEDEEETANTPTLSPEGLTWMYESKNGEDIKVVTFTAKIQTVEGDFKDELGDESQDQSVVIPNFASFGIVDAEFITDEYNQISLDTNTVKLNMKPTEEEPEEEEDPTLPIHPDGTVDKPISGNSAPNQVSESLTPAGSVTTGTPVTDTLYGTSAGSTPTASQTTLTSRYAATPIATAFGAHPVLWTFILLGTGSLGAALFWMKHRKSHFFPKFPKL